MPSSISNKLKHTVRIDRAISLVWRASPGWTLVNAGLVIVQGVLPLISLYLIKRVIDTISEAVSAEGADGTLSSMIILVAIAAAIALVQTGLEKLSAYVTEAQSSVVGDYVHDVMHKKSIELDLSYYENAEFQDTLHRAQSEGPHRPTTIVRGLHQLAQNAISLAVMAGLLFTFHWSVGILLFVSTLPGLLTQIVFAGKRFRWQKEITPSERKASYYHWILTGTYFAKEVRLFGLGPYFSDVFRHLRGEIRKEKLALSRHRAIAECLSQAFATLALMGCFLFIGIRTVKGAITLGDMAMYYQAFQRGLSHLKSFLLNLSQLYEDNLFVSHFFTFLDAENKLVETANPVPVPSQRPMPVELNDITFSYPGVREPVLKGVSFNINPGEVVALVGPNGAGKSTLVKLLCRLYDPNTGHIFFGENDYRQFSSAELRGRISVVFQDFVHYHMTVRDNIRLGDVNKKDDQDNLEAAANRAGARELISRLPHGYDTMLGKWFESGEELSYGEWQKLVIARAFYRDASLVILDEPSSSLDADSEYQLFRNFKNLIEGKSALIISHRFSTVKMADRILVLENGGITENGSHDELMALNGRYAEMYKKQSAWKY
ncbi:MAG: ABC transporter ATP-binding protein [Lentisphaeria bacterium]|nr:ABC transporter ATP-binding protein [Lentisphaeria bacterium]